MGASPKCDEATRLHVSLLACQAQESLVARIIKSAIDACHSALELHATTHTACGDRQVRAFVAYEDRIDLRKSPCKV